MPEKGSVSELRVKRGLAGAVNSTRTGTVRFGSGTRKVTNRTNRGQI